MLIFQAEFAAHLQERARTLTVAYAIRSKTGEWKRGTAHDRDLPIASGPYAGVYRARAAAFASDLRSTADGSISNLEVEGTFRVDATVDDITPAEIEGGLYDQARTFLLMVNWASPNDGQKVLMSGTLGEFYRDSDGRYRSECRGKAQNLRQQIMRTFCERCDVKVFGDDRCKFNLAAVTRTGTIATVADRRHFTVTLDAGPAPITPTYYYGGLLTFTDGDNEDFVKEMKVADLVSSTLTVELWEEAPADIEVGGHVTVPPGCDRKYETCRDVHDNLINIRAPGLYAVGKDRLMRGPIGP